MLAHDAAMERAASEERFASVEAAKTKRVRLHLVRAARECVGIGSALRAHAHEREWPSFANLEQGEGCVRYGVVGEYVLP